MTDIKITKNGNSITKVVCQGHTGYAEEGSDILCAALSSIVQTAALGLLQVVGVNIGLITKEGFLQLTVPENISKEKRRDCDIILGTMYLGLTDLYENYSDFINMEVRQ